MSQTITQQLKALETATVAELAAQYEALHGVPPRVKNKGFLRRRVAWKLQEREYGGLSDRAKARLEELLAQVDLPLKPVPPKRPAKATTATKAPILGTTLVREWHGETYRVQVVEGGFEWNGTLYRSLSAVARAITSSNWNGRLFFGLTQRRAAGDR